jgi:hypothetical protein
MNYDKAEPPRAVAHVVLFCDPRRSVKCWAEINCDVCHSARPRYVRGRQRSRRELQDHCEGRERLTRPGGILDGAMEKELINGSRHGPLSE